MGDFNQDNRIDITVSNFAGDQSRSQMMISTDLNNDSILDIAVANTGSNTIGILIGFGNGSFRSSRTLSTGTDSRPTFLVVDIVFAEQVVNSITIFLAAPNRTLISKITYSTVPGVSPSSIAVGDFNNGNHSYSVVVNYENGPIGIYLGNGDRTFTNAMDFSVGSGVQPTSVSVTDFNNDNRLHIAVAAAYHNAIYVLLGYGNDALAYKLPFASGYFYNPLQIVVEEFNDDGRLDCAVIDYYYYRLYAFFGSVNEDFLEISTFSTSYKSAPPFVSTIYLNRDNILDLVVTNSGSNNFGVFLGLIFGFFAQQLIFPTGNDLKSSSLALDDFNNDNNLRYCCDQFWLR
ncbi:unnamed protein product [Rotaria magnacalcarata]|nr:unnamed protein product [Rotaria magnacalcarata]